MPEMASAFKVAYHREKLEAYLRGEMIFPATLELDITSACNRNCPYCPSTTRLASYDLTIDFIERLFSHLEGQTKGLLLTGGEPTMAPTFPDVLRMARKRGFADVAVVTNGTLLTEERVAAALLAYASTIRVSLYDWSSESCEELYPTLKRIEALRSRIDREGSSLQIGVSALTSRENADGLGAVTREAASAGAHWIYFHPMCIRWDAGSPTRVDQTDVLAKIEERRNGQPDGFEVFAFDERYADRAIEFNGYHAAHFLLVVGADAMNYLGAEVKYQPQHAIADLAGQWYDGFLWQKQRLKRIQSVNSKTYPAIDSRHRGMLYNDLIEKLMKRNRDDLDVMLTMSPNGFMFPHIL
ncbi:MAG: radical SAM protein [Chloroflexi bacterium]|nr:radical SAM protein [Chloroflexota bacterium]